MGINFSTAFDQLRAQLNAQLMDQYGLSPEMLEKGKNAARTITPITAEQAQQYQETNGAAFPGMYALDLSDYGGSGWGLAPLGTVQQMWNMKPREDDGGGFLKGLANAGQEMKGGLSIMAMPLMAAAGAGAFGGAGAGAEGAGAAGTVGEFGAEPVFGGSGSEALAGGAGADTLGSTGADTLSMPAAQAENPFGDYNIDPNTGDVFDGPGQNPYTSNFSGGDTNAFFNGVDPSGSGPGLMQQAKDLAAQYGITPASALALVKQGAGLIGKAAPAALGAVGAKQQADSLSALAEKYMALGAPSRDRYEASYEPGFTMMNDPGYKDALDQSSKATLHGLSVQGNPAGSPNAWAQSLNDLYAKTAYPALQNFRNTNANAGGIASLQTAAPAAATGAIGAQANIFNAIGGGLNDIFSPKQTLAEQLADLRRQGLY